MTSVEGIETPLARVEIAEWTICTPSSTPMMWLRLAIAVRLWKCISSGTPPAAARSCASRIQRRARSGPSTPASSPSRIVSAASPAIIREITSA